MIQAEWMIPLEMLTIGIGPLVPSSYPSRTKNTPSPEGSPNNRNILTFQDSMNLRLPYHLKRWTEEI